MDEIEIEIEIERRDETLRTFAEVVVLGYGQQEKAYLQPEVIHMSLSLLLAVFQFYCNTQPGLFGIRITPGRGGATVSIWQCPGHIERSTLK